jgi:hypothetical protein
MLRRVAGFARRSRVPSAQSHPAQGKVIIVESLVDNVEDTMRGANFIENEEHSLRTLGDPVKVRPASKAILEHWMTIQSPMIFGAQQRSNELGCHKSYRFFL